MTEQHSKKNGHYTSTKQAAEELGRDERTIRRWIEDNKVASVKRNGQRLIPQAEVERLRLEMPDLVPPTADRLAALEENNQKQAERLAALEENDQKQAKLLKIQEEQIQELLRRVEQLQDGSLAAGDHHHRLLTNQDRQAGTAKRGYPAGTVYLVTFARQHQLEKSLSLLKELYWGKEIELAVYHRTGEPKRNGKEWWITPEQHLTVIRYCALHGVPYQPCDQCACEHTTLSD